MLREARIYITVLALALIAACATAPQTPAQAVYAASSTYLVALDAAVAYRRLPQCDLPAAPTLCAKPAVVHDLQRADDVAYAALGEAQALVRSTAPASRVEQALAAARQAINIFAAIAQGAKP